MKAATYVLRNFKCELKKKRRTLSYQEIVLRIKEYSLRKLALLLRSYSVPFLLPRILIRRRYVGRYVEV